MSKKKTRRAHIRPNIEIGGVCGFGRKNSYYGNQPPLSLATNKPGPRPIHPEECQSDTNFSHRVEQNLCRANDLSCFFNALVGPFAFSLVFYCSKYVRPSPQQQSLGEATHASICITFHPFQSLRKAAHAPLVVACTSTMGGYYTTTIRQL